MLLEQVFDALEMNDLTFVRALKNFSITNVAKNETQRELQTMI